MYQIYLYFGMTPHVSDGVSVHHQEFKTVRTATGICQTDTAVCLLAGTCLPDNSKILEEPATSIFRVEVTVSKQMSTSEMST